MSLKNISIICYNIPIKKRFVTIWKRKIYTYDLNQVQINSNQNFIKTFLKTKKIIKTI